MYTTLETPLVSDGRHEAVPRKQISISAAMSLLKRESLLNS